MDKLLVRRYCALLKAEVELGRPFPFELPEGFKESFENQKHFTGWINYHVTWDTTNEDPWTIYPRKKSLEAEWHAELIKHVPVIAPNGQIMEQEEWEQKSASTQQPK